MIDNLPENLTEAVHMLAAQLTANNLVWWQSTSFDDAMVYLHHGAGTNLRNDWGLWEKDSPMSVWFRQHGIWHSDDMSAIIFKALWCHVNNEPFDITTEAQYCMEFWRAEGMGFDGENLT